MHSMSGGMMRALLASALTVVLASCASMLEDLPQAEQDVVRCVRDTIVSSGWGRDVEIHMERGSSGGQFDPVVRFNYTNQDGETYHEWVGVLAFRNGVFGYWGSFRFPDSKRLALMLEERCNVKESVVLS